MQFLTPEARPYQLDSFTAPLGTTHFWTLSGHMMDFKLEEIQYLEEIVGQTIRIRIDNMELDLPASWSVLAVDKETYTIDMVPIAHCASFDHDLLLFSPNDSKLKTCKAIVVDYQQKGLCVAPEIPKGSALVHPVMRDMMHGKSLYYGIVVSPHDIYRYIAGKTVGDILG